MTSSGIAVLTIQRTDDVAVTKVSNVILRTTAGSLGL